MIDAPRAAPKRSRVRAPESGSALRILVTGRPAAHVVLAIAGALAATAFGALGYDYVQHALLVALTALTGLRALVFASIRPLSKAATLFLVPAPFLFMLSVIASGRLTGNHLYLIFLLAFVLTLEFERPLEPRLLLRITNAYYLVYLAMSLLVYFGVVDLGRELNTFDATRRVPWLEFKTLVGFYGSTAHIDAISLFVALVNLLFGRGKSRQVLVAIAVAASLASVRFTPFVALSIALLGTWFVSWFKRAGSVRRAVAVTVALSIVLSAPLSMLAAELFPSGRLERLINLATNGRLLIWQTMGGVFSEAPLLKQVFGTGSTEPYYLVGGWPRVHPVTKEVSEFWTANPHNSYLSVALNLGLAVFVLLALAISYLVAQMRNRRAMLITLYVLSVGITNAELFTFFYPIYVVWLLWLSRMSARRGYLAARRRGEAPPSVDRAG